MDQEMLRPKRLRRDIYIAAALVIVAFALAISVSIDRSSRVANKFALDAEQRLMGYEFDRLRRQTVDQQAEISHWDTTIEAVTQPAVPDAEFVSDEIAAWLGEDFGFNQIAIVDAKGVVKVGIVDGNVLGPDAKLPVVADGVTYVDAALGLYRTNRQGEEGTAESGTSNDVVIPDIAISNFHVLNGQIGIITAQVIIPETRSLLPAAGQEHVMLAFKPLTQATLKDVERRLNIANLQLTVGDFSHETAAHLHLVDHDGTVAFKAVWTPYAPRAAILSAVLPLAGALMALICALMIFMLSRHRNTVVALAESEARNRFLANHDALTGLANRGQLDQRFETLFDGHGQSSFAVMCIDLDSFKAVNDNHGHHAGDLVLQTVARRFAERIGEAGMVARVGGDEFIALITMNTEAELLRMLASGITSDATTPVPFGSLALQVGASVGVAVYPFDGRKPRELIAAADAALYESKRNGRGRVTFADRDNVCELSAYQGRERRTAPSA